jgi:hypothetical protein
MTPVCEASCLRIKPGVVRRIWSRYKSERSAESIIHLLIVSLISVKSRATPGPSRRKIPASNVRRQMQSLQTFRGCAPLTTHVAND